MDICNQSLPCAFTLGAVALNTDSRTGSISVLSCPSVVSRQVGEIEEQLAAARREVTKSEEANQKLQREVKEVRMCQSLSPLANDPVLPRLPGLRVYI